jgi:ankyrin repeat protein
MLAWFYSKIASIFSSIISWFFPSYNNRRQLAISEVITNKDWEGAEELVNSEQSTFTNIELDNEETLFLHALENGAPDNFFASFIKKSNWKNIIGLAGKHRETFDILTSINGRTNLLNCVDCEGNTATNYVARDLCDKDNTAMLERLLSLPDVAFDPQNNGRRPVLFYALKYGLPGELITKIIYKSKKITAFYNYRTAPDNNRSAQDVTGSSLHHAAYLGRTDVVRILLEHPAFSKAPPLNAIDGGGNTAMLSAILKGAWEIVELLWLTGKINLSYRKEGRTYRSWARNTAMPPHVSTMLSYEGNYSLDEAESKYKEKSLDEAESKYKEKLSIVLKRRIYVQDWNVLKRLLENGAVDDLDVLDYAISKKAPNEIVKTILGNITDLDFYFHDYITPLIYAVICNKVELVKCLLNHPAWIAIANTVDGNQSTALNWAVYQQKWDIAKLLLEKGGEEIDALLPDNRRKGPLYYALERGGDDEIVTMLIICATPAAALASLSENNMGYFNRVWKIIEQKYPEQLEKIARDALMRDPFPKDKRDLLLSKITKENINAHGGDGHNLLSIAIKQKDFKFADELIRRGAKLSSIPNYIAEGLLISCIRANKEDIFKQLLYGEIYEESYASVTRRLININYILDGSESLLMAAIRHKCLGIVKLLLEDSRINIRLSRGDGNTALTLAVLSGEPEILAELLKHRNIGEIANNIAERPGTAYRGTALHMAVQTGQPEMVKLLLNLDGMDPTISQGTSYERTPLVWALEKKKVAMVSAFLDKFSGLDIIRQDIDNYLRFTREIEIVKVILKKIPDLDLTQQDESRRSSAYYIITACPESIPKLTEDSDLESAISEKSLVALYVETLEELSRLNQWTDKREELSVVKILLEEKVDMMDALLYALHSWYYNASDSIFSSLNLQGYKRLALPLDKDSIGHIVSFLPNLDKKNAQGKTAFQLALDLGYYHFAAKLLQAGATDLGIVSPEQFTNIFQPDIWSRQDTISLFLRLMKGYGITTNKLEHIQNAATLLTMDAMRLDIIPGERIKSVFIKLLAAGKVEVVEKVLPQIPLSILSDITEASVPYKIPQETEGLFAVISGREEALASIENFLAEASRTIVPEAASVDTRGISTRILDGVSAEELQI